jgi:hypothetical protein
LASSPANLLTGYGVQHLENALTCCLSRRSRYVHGRKKMPPCKFWIKLVGIGSRLIADWPHVSTKLLIAARGSIVPSNPSIRTLSEGCHALPLRPSQSETVQITPLPSSSASYFVYFSSFIPSAFPIDLSSSYSSSWALLLPPQRFPASKPFAPFSSMVLDLVVTTTMYDTHSPH